MHVGFWYMAPPVSHVNQMVSFGTHDTLKLQQE